MPGGTSNRSRGDRSQAAGLAAAVLIFRGKTLGT
jgi:hypothetical protein